MSVSVPFRWPKGPSLVEVSGDWDEWKKKVSLDRQGDGSFSKEVSNIVKCGRTSRGIIL